MRSRTRMIAVAAVAATALTAGGTAAAMASTAGAAPGAHAKTVSATVTKKPGPPAKPRPPSEQQGHDALVAAMAGQLHVSPARVAAALAPLFAAGRADSSSPAFAAAARMLGVSPQRLNAALVQAKESLGRGAPPPASGSGKSRS